AWSLTKRPRTREARLVLPVARFAEAIAVPQERPRSVPKNEGGWKMSKLPARQFSMSGLLVVLALLMAWPAMAAARRKSGACCLATGCRILSERQCRERGGIYQGDGTTCSATTCPPL